MVRHWGDTGDLRSFSEKCMDGFLALTHSGYATDECQILAFYPYVKGNPFQKMLYASAERHGVAPIALRHVEELDDVPPAMKAVAHFHWVNHVFAAAKNEREAEKAASQFLEKVQNLKERGVKTVWTLHNIISHEARFEKVEATFRNELADLVDIIHVMNPRTAALCAPLYTLDSRKIIETPHPSYAGIYSNYASKFQARLDLGLPAVRPVFLLFGSLMPQKGTYGFLTEIDTLQEKLSGKAVFLLAGQAKDRAVYEEVSALVNARSDIKFMPERVDDHNMQTLFKAADVVVCPYTRGLNSGVVITAASFGRPVVAPTFIKPVLREVEGAITEYDPQNNDSCYTACVEAYEQSKDTELEGKLLNWATENAAPITSGYFFEALKKRL